MSLIKGTLKITKNYSEFLTWKIDYLNSDVSKYSLVYTDSDGAIMGSNSSSFVSYSGGSFTNNTTKNKYLSGTYKSYPNIGVIVLKYINNYIIVPMFVYYGDNVYFFNGNNWITSSVPSDDLEFNIPDNIYQSSGLSHLVTSGNIKAAVYNGKSYPPGATIPLDPSVENISLVNQNYTMTMVDTQNIKEVRIDNDMYKDFPATINVEKNTVLQMSGKDDPVITVDYTNTKKPTVTNT